MLNIDSSTADAIWTATSDMASHSPFLPEQCTPHITILGSLHVYAEANIIAAAKTAAAQCGPVAGRFVKWQLTKSKLRVLVEVESLPELQRALQSRLPKGRTWQPLHINIGSIKDIDPALHKAFLDAVEAAYPIVRESTFTASILEYENDDVDRPNPPCVNLQGVIPKGAPNPAPKRLSRALVRRTPGPDLPVRMDVEPPGPSIKKKPHRKSAT